MRHFLCMALLFFVTSCTEQTVLVYEDNGEKQCEGGGITLPESTEKLETAGVEVLESHCGVQTGVFVTAVCGARTTGILVHRVASHDLEKSRNLGFREIDTLVNKDKGTDYEIRQCSDT